MSLATWIVAGVCWGSCIAYFTWTALHDRKPPKRLVADPYELRRKRQRVQRALRREHIFTTDHEGRERLGLK